MSTVICMNKQYTRLKSWILPKKAYVRSVDVDYYTDADLNTRASRYSDVLE